MTLYEMNQALYQKAPPIEDPHILYKKIERYLRDWQFKYYLILNHELHYYTFYVKKYAESIKAMARDMADLISDLGEIKDVVLSEDGRMLEIWITCKQDNKTHMFGLFEYHDGVIEV